jgi:hypothetical protein
MITGRRWKACSDGNLDGLVDSEVDDPGDQYLVGLAARDTGNRVETGAAA